MEELQRVIEAEALFMDALGGEFTPKLEPTTPHTLARLARNMLADLAEMPMQHDGNTPESIRREVAWAPGMAYLNCAPFEMRSFGRYGQRGQPLFIPTELGFSIDRSGYGVRALRFEFFHPALFCHVLQPNGPAKGFDDGGYIEISTVSYSDRSDGSGRSDIGSIEKKLGLTEVKHGSRARQAIAEIVELAF